MQRFVIKFANKKVKKVKTNGTFVRKTFLLKSIRSAAQLSVIYGTCNKKNPLKWGKLIMFIVGKLINSASNQKSLSLIVMIIFMVCYQPPLRLCILD